MSSPRICLMVVTLLLALAHPVVGRAQDRPPDNPVLAEGIALHNKGQVDQAIAKFKEVLDLEPNNVEALYCMARACYSKRDFTAAIEFAKHGATFEHTLRPALWMLIGNAYDMQGNTDQAVAAYQSGIEKDPAYALLHFNLAVAYLKAKRVADARLSFERSVSLDPNHASSHLNLALAYAIEGYKVPALLAFCRFLILEPATARSREAVVSIDRLFASGIQQTADGKMSMTVSDKREEGDFVQQEASMAIANTVAARVAGQTGHAWSPATKLYQTLHVMFDKWAPRTTGFAADYYVPYFKELLTQKHDTAIANIIMQSSGSPEVRQWLADNEGAAQAALAWSKTYAWPQLPATLKKH